MGPGWPGELAEADVRRAGSPMRPQRISRQVICGLQTVTAAIGHGRDDERCKGQQGRGQQGNARRAVRSCAGSSRASR